MQPDDLICYCHHVSLRKLVRFAQRERPQHASQMSECLGAGTGCGWCIPFLRQISEGAGSPEGPPLDASPEWYAEARARYRAERRGPEGT